MLGYVKNRLTKRLNFWKKDQLKQRLAKFGLKILLFTIAWEILEDVIFPVIFLFLGNRVHPVFFGLIPVSWLMCLHPIMIPIFVTFLSWRESKKTDHDRTDDCCDDPHTH